MHRHGAPAFAALTLPRAAGRRGSVGTVKARLAS